MVDWDLWAGRFWVGPANLYRMNIAASWRRQGPTPTASFAFLFVQNCGASEDGLLLIGGPCGPPGRGVLYTQHAPTYNSVRLAAVPLPAVPSLFGHISKTQWTQFNSTRVPGRWWIHSTKEAMFTYFYLWMEKATQRLGSSWIYDEQSGPAGALISLPSTHNNAS